MAYPKNIQDQILILQKAEIEGYYQYLFVSRKMKDRRAAAIVEKIGKDELRHYKVFRKYSGVEHVTNKRHLKRMLLKYNILQILFGVTFVLKIFEKKESDVTNYKLLQDEAPELAAFAVEEEAHEAKLISIIKEERLDYMGSIVLGLNDALVELTGALAGFTLSLSNNITIASIGLITGLAATMSMAASAFLSANSDAEPGDKTSEDTVKEAEDEGPSPKKKAAVTGFAYLVTVIILTLPFFLLTNRFIALGIMLMLAILIIALFNYYYSVVKSSSFIRSFGQMVIISMGVAAASFIISFFVTKIFGI